MVNELTNEGAKICAYDPEAMNNVRKIIGDKISYADNQYDCLEGVDALIIATEWNEFRRLIFKNCHGDERQSDL